jgi:hypothetical protein
VTPSCDQGSKHWERPFFCQPPWISLFSAKQIVMDRKK